jgi:hypothetical protein
MLDISKLFEMSYPMGTEVIVIDDDDHVLKGKIVGSDDEGMEVLCGKTQPDFVRWVELRFIAPYDYPVKRTRAPWRTNKDTELTALRRAAAATKRREQRRRAAFGDPFEVEGLVTSAHVGNSGRIWGDTFFSEVLVFEHDGMTAMLWDFESVFEFGA